MAMAVIVISVSMAAAIQTLDETVTRPPSLPFSSSWNELFPNVGPLERVYHSAVHNASGDRMILFGGLLGTSKNDVWVLRNSTGIGGPPEWTQVFPTGTLPTVRYAHTAVYDDNLDRMVVFGGIGAGRKNDVWILKNASAIGVTPSWEPLAPVGGPPAPRNWHSAVLDQATARMVVLGGENGYSNEVWVLENATGTTGTPTWTLLSPAGAPPSGRAGHTAVYNQASRRMVVFSGYNSGGLFNDTWVLENATGLLGPSSWSLLVPIGQAPVKRGLASAVIDTAAERMIVFGGGITGGKLNDVWILTDPFDSAGSPAWSELNPSGGPPLPRYGHSAILDPGANRMVVFGGNTDSGAVPDVWVLTEANGIPAVPGAIVAALLLAIPASFSILQVSRGRVDLRPSRQSPRRCTQPD